MYYYCLTWLSSILQLLCVTFSIGAGLFYLAEIVEEYAYVAKKYLNLLIIIDTFFAIGLIIFEDLPILIVGLCIACNFLYFVSIRTFPVIEIFSPAFICSIILFVFHNYYAFNHFSSNYYQFSEVLCYMTLFCWFIPIILLCSCSANDNVLPTTSVHQKKNEDVVSNYFSNKNKKYGLLTFMRYFQDNYLPNRQTTRKLY